MRIDSLMLNVPPPDRHNWAMLYSKRNIYGLQNITKQEWEAWVLRNPKNSLTSKELGGQTSSVADKHIGLKRERRQ